MAKIDPAYHPKMLQPDDPNTFVWRYMDLAKFMETLLHARLPLVRLDQLPDKFEGTFPELAEQAFVAWLRRNGTVKDADIEAYMKHLRLWSPHARMSTYVSCWRLHNSESEAMWRLYCATDNGIAIALPYKDLFAAVQRIPLVPRTADVETGAPMVGEVNYIDFRKEFYEPGNSFDLAMHKRLEFQYEREVRIVKTALPVRNRLPIEPLEAWPKDWPVARHIPLAPTLIQKVVVSPYAKSWFVDVVRDVIARLVPVLSSRIELSAMK